MSDDGKPQSSGRGAATVYEVTVVPAVVYRVRPTPESGTGEWADAFVREWPRGGSISIQSSFGDFAYTWTSIGSDTFRTFLRSLNFEYFMGKACPKDFREFDLDLTVQGIRENLLKARRQGDLSKEDARTCWSEIEEEISGWGDQEFHGRIPETEIVKLLYGQDPSAVPLRSRVNVQCQRFWQEIWPVLCDAWQVPAAEIAA